MRGREFLDLARESLASGTLPATGERSLSTPITHCCWNAGTP